MWRVKLGCLVKEAEGVEYVLKGSVWVNFGILVEFVVDRKFGNFVEKFPGFFPFVFVGLRIEIYIFCRSATDCRPKKQPRAPAITSDHVTEEQYWGIG